MESTTDLSKIREEMRQKISLYAYETFPGDSLKDEQRRKNIIRILYDRVLIEKDLDLNIFD